MGPNGPTLQDTFAMAFTKEKILHEWVKYGINPFTHKALQSKKLQHGIVADDDGNVDTTTDPKAACLQGLGKANNLTCDMLSSIGHDGNRLR
jgi:hypothetical protein